PGTYAMQWRMEQQGGVGAFGASSTYTPITVAARVDDAQFVSQSKVTTANAGAAMTWSVVMKNTGNTTWKVGKHVLPIQPPGSTKWVLTSMALSGDVAPGVQWNITGTLTVPTELTYHDMQWRMQNVGGSYFGEVSPLVTIAASGAAPTTVLQ